MSSIKKDLRHMKRSDLVEIIYCYQQNEKKLQEENETLKKQLAERSIKMSKVGSIAEAALSINGVFESAQAAANQYMKEVYSLRDDMENRAKMILTDAQKQAEAIKAQAENECIDMKRKTEDECRLMIEKSHS